MIEIETMRSWLAGEPVWPYAKVIETWGSDYEDWRIKMSRVIRESKQAGVASFRSTDEMRARLERGVELYKLRTQWVAEFGFAIPCAELLDALAEHGPIVEVGAGTGYMTVLMRDRGIDVIGSDADWRGPGAHGFEVGKHDEQQNNGVEAKTMVRRYRDRTAFCSWPTLNTTWFRQMLKAMQIGQKLIVIRETACAEHTAWAYLDEKFEELATIRLPVFERISDFAQVCVKKRR